MKRALFASILGLSVFAAGPVLAAEDDTEDTAASDVEDTDASADADEDEASGDASSADEAQKEDSDADDDFGHGGQFGLRVGLVPGYRMIFRYDTSPYCADYDPTKSNSDQLKFCGHGAPLAINFGLSYGLLDFFEPYVWFRLGLASEKKTNTAPVKLLGVGARLYTMSDSAFKIFVEPAIAYEFEGEADPPLPRVGGYNPNYKRDLVLHFAAGPQIDLHKHFGLYATGGITAGVLRAIHSSLELEFGLQGRL